MFQKHGKWSLDASFGAALDSGKFKREEMVFTKTLCNYVDLGLLPIKISTYRRNFVVTLKPEKHVKTRKISAEASKNVLKSLICAQNSVIGR